MVKMVNVIYLYFTIIKNKFFLIIGERKTDGNFVMAG